MMLPGDAPVLSVLGGLESPFMDIVRYKHIKEIEQSAPPADSPTASLSPSVAGLRVCEIKITEDTAPFTIPDTNVDINPYVSLKMKDEMSTLYKTVLGNRLNNKLTLSELRPKLEVVKAKHQMACRAINNGTSEFNFLFRDFIGHMSILLEASMSRQWAVNLLLPFLQCRRQEANYIQAYTESSSMIRQLCQYEHVDSQLASSLVTEVWDVLIELVKENRKPAEVACRTASCIIENAPLTQSDIVYKVMMMRHLYTEFFSKEMGTLRMFRIATLGKIYSRLLTEGSAVRNHSGVIQDLIVEARDTLHLEPNPFARRKLCELFNIQHDSGGENRPKDTLSTPSTDSPDVYHHAHTRTQYPSDTTRQNREYYPRPTAHNRMPLGFRPSNRLNTPTAARIGASKVEKARFARAFDGRRMNWNSQGGGLIEQLRAKRGLVKTNAQNFYRAHLKDRLRA